MASRFRWGVLQYPQLWFSSKLNCQDRPISRTQIRSPYPSTEHLEPDHRDKNFVWKSFHAYRSARATIRTQIFGFNSPGIIHVATQPILGDRSLQIESSLVVGDTKSSGFFYSSRQGPGGIPDSEAGGCVEQGCKFLEGSFARAVHA